MKQAIGLKFVRLCRGKEQMRPMGDALELCRNAGFMLLDYLSPLDDENFLETAKRERELIDSFGMRVLQSHCPFFRYEQNGLEKFRKAAPKAVRAAAALGAKYFVIHADESRPAAGEAFDPEKVLEATREYLAPVIEQCVQSGLCPAIENLFEENLTGPRSRYTHFPEEVISVIKSFPGANIGCCWDAGHLNVSSGGGEAFLEQLKKLSPYISCTHIHDNRYGIDMHKPAFFGNIPWEDVMKILKQNHYAGDFCWEFVYERMPDVLQAEYLKFIHATGEYLIRQFDEAE